MEITLSLQAVFTAVVTVGGGLIVFFLQRIYSQFEKVVEQLSDTRADVKVLRTEYGGLEKRVAVLEQRDREAA